MPQTVALKVYVRPRWAWWAGALVLLLGTVLSWGSTVWLVRRRQLAANELLIGRLDGLLEHLKKQLEGLQQPDPPQRTQTLDHIAEIREKKLEQLYDDKVLAVLAGMEVPASPQPTVLDEIECVIRVVQDGFVKLSEMFQAHSSQSAVLSPFFKSMDDEGGKIGPKATIEDDIKSIVNNANTALTTAVGSPKPIIAAYGLKPLKQEAAVVQRLVRSTYWFDLISIAVVVVVGVYVTIWKNPGFGTVGDLLIAFGWGLVKSGRRSALKSHPQYPKNVNLDEGV